MSLLLYRNNRQISYYYLHSCEKYIMINSVRKHEIFIDLLIKEIESSSFPNQESNSEYVCTSR